MNNIINSNKKWNKHNSKINSININIMIINNKIIVDKYESINKLKKSNFLNQKSICIDKELILPFEPRYFSIKNKTKEILYKNNVLIK